MNNFYTFYTKNFGKASETAFQLFWNADYERCYQFYNKIINIVGSIEAMGFGDALIYYHCSRQIGAEIFNEIKIPPPPSRHEIINLFNYEISQEMSINRHSNRSILTQPSIINKAVLAAFIGIENGCEQAIETGTFLGGSSYIFTGSFESVDTIEADPRLHESSRIWLASKTKNAVCHLGNSSEILPQVIANRVKKQLIFLDAHYSTGITSREYGVCPLLRELEIIINSQIKAVIVVDDIRCMGTSGYPSLKDIIDIIPEGRRATIHYDQLVII